MLKYLLHRAGFHDGAIAQHDRLLGDGPDEGEVVGDEEHGQVAFALEPELLAKMYEPREIVSPTQAQKVLKSGYEVVKDLVTQSDPQLRLVPLDHKGEAVTPIQFIPTQEPGLI